MAQTDSSNTVTDLETYREYILGVRITERTTADGETRYRFEAPDHQGIEFGDPEMATLYADVYFDVNGFQEAGTGERGVPPTVIQAGRDTLVAYFLTQDGVDVHWAASFYGEKPEKIERYISRVRKRSKKIREGAKEQGHA
ncbi:hypothetical protein [Haloarcula japonica]|uniref:Uncharacterized protein n=1 Tax=Haloarcula japonica (strain ATCC 49778 / DSM 6131 / JCM 7785 / NBRC 101032 / NCIMB 13157 / TR-1) TaxID=1227453 RepID=M0LCD5_HALJT|nr:hypothetical protein [Haloarcula japonica]EMA30079.1 hypothetical protein C444_11155 [Haloarcula japonica DSM 6131]